MKVQSTHAIDSYVKALRKTIPQSGVILFPMEHKPIKDAVYHLRANPVMHESGSLAGQLDHVRFTADGGIGIHKEWQVDAGTLDKMLHSLESSSIRHEVLNNLRKGARVNLPGVFTTADLMKFGFSATS